MKIVKNIIRLCAAALAVLPIFGCSEEEYVKPSALLSESSLTFEAIVGALVCLLYRLTSQIDLAEIITVFLSTAK